MGIAGILFTWLLCSGCFLCGYAVGAIFAKKGVADELEQAREFYRMAAEEAKQVSRDIEALERIRDTL